MIDSHCHLTYDPLLSQIDGVLSRAAGAGVSACVTIGTSVDDTRKAIALAHHKSGPNAPIRIFVSSGVHPHEAGKVTDGWDAALAELAVRPGIVAVGETGLDYHYDFADQAAQRRVFERQLEIAGEARKPVVIHCREAHRDTLDVLAGFDIERGVVFHCFTGTLAEAEEILARGYWISLTGVVTFKKSDEIRRVAAMIPADRIMVETDSPYLSPEPVRSMRPNEPANVAYTAKAVAAARGVSIAELDRLTVDNTRRFFGLSD